MIAAFVALTRFIRTLWRALREPEFRALFYIVAFTIIVGTLFYRQAEGWGWVDSLYFSVITLTTVGYGDLTPTTPVSKLFTIVYILLGLGILVTFASKLAGVILSERPKRPVLFKTRLKTSNQDDTEISSQQQESE